MNARLKSIVRGPAEGWISLLLVAVMTLTIAWSMDDAKWVLGRDHFLDFLVPVTVWGVVVAFAGAKLGWGRWLTYLLGAVLAALFVPLYVGNLLLPDASWVDQYRATATSVVEAWTDLAVQNQTVTREYGHFLMVLGSFVWASAMFASFATFGHHRPLNAIVLVGLLLVGNMSFTYNDQLTFLVIFTLAALFLLIRFHAFDEESEWLRRRIGDPGTVSGIYLRGGTAFIAIAVIGSLVLTQTASSAPLAGALRGVGDNVVEWGRGLERLLPQGGANRPFGVDFGDTARLGNNWNFAPGRAMVIEVPDDAPRGMYWRAAAYDTVEPGAWRQRERIGVPVEPGVALLPEGAADYVTADGRQEVTFRVIPEGYQRAVLFSPAMPTSVDHAVRLSVIGGEGFFGAIEGNGNAPYTITALVPVVGDDDDSEGLTANRLRVAGTNYPDDVEARFLEVPADVAGPGGASANLLEEIRTAANDPDNPYDLAFAMQQYLRSSAFRYHTDLGALSCDGLSVADCFARERVGFCQQYATTMAVMLRMAGIPSRYVSGFLPGPRVEGVERISFSQAHAWVEAYFPGHGWVQFDPTGGGLDGQADPLPPGEVIASPSPSSSTAPGSAGAAPTRRPFDEPPVGPAVQGGTNTPGANDSAGILIAVTLLLLITVGGLAYVAWQRGPRGDVTPDGAYSALTRMAGRLGFGPRPTQTVYEFAGALGEVLPQSRPEIQTVAQAKVEVAYGRRALGADRMAALSDAQRRLRVGLLRLLLRRGGKSRRRR
jgi:hypothetical protein